MAAILQFRAWAEQQLQQPESTGNCAELLLMAAGNLVLWLEKNKSVA